MLKSQQPITPWQIIAGAPPTPKGHEEVSGFALTESGRVVIAYAPENGEKRTIYELNRAKEVWDRLDVPATNPSISPALKGNAGDDLIFAGATGRQFRVFGF